jgi:hypothetical protein
LKAKYPNIAAEWHPRNTTSPEDYTSGSNKKFWWLCTVNPCGCHEWEASIHGRTQGSNCPFCSSSCQRRICPHNNLEVLYPEISLEWNYDNNNRRPNEYLPGSGDMIWWKCSNDPCGCHRWQATIHNRVNGTGCPYCNGTAAKPICPHNNFEILHNELMTEWHPRNNTSPTEYLPGSDKVVWWQCSIDPSHEWKCRINYRKRSRGCPLCSKSKGEQVVSKILTDLGIQFISEYKHHLLPTKRYDFYFHYNGKNFLIEYDGLQHFQDVAFFNKKVSFEQKQEIDRIKTYVALYTQYILIRISYNNDTEESIKDHIIEGIKSDSYYYSDPELYEYLTLDPVNLDVLNVNYINKPV